MTSPPPSVTTYARHVNPAFVNLLGVFGYGRLVARLARVPWLTTCQDCWTLCRACCQFQ